MKKMKYIDAAMEIVNFDFEDVLEISDYDNPGQIENLDDIDGADNADPWTNS